MYNLYGMILYTSYVAVKYGSIGLTFMLASATSSSLVKGMLITALALSLCTVKGIHLQHKHMHMQKH